MVKKYSIVNLSWDEISNVFSRISETFDMPVYIYPYDEAIIISDKEIDEYDLDNLSENLQDEEDEDDND